MGAILYGCNTDVTVSTLFREFLGTGAGSEVNIDGKTMEETKLAMKNPTRHTFDRAADHVYTLLLKKDCYPRSDRRKNGSSALNPGAVFLRFFTVFFLLFLTSARGSNPAGQIF